MLLLDNYDSFVHNLARYFERLGQKPCVVRSDQIDVDAIRRCAPQAIVLSPGPSTPENAGCCMEVVRQLHAQIPILGVCLGHQAIAAAFGGRVIRGEPRHGRTSAIDHAGSDHAGSDHAGSGLFAGVASPLTACRYHSLVVEEASLPPALQVTARTNDGTIMGIQHRHCPVFGLQFHPESILTADGYRLLANFLTLAGIATTVDPAQLAATERIETSDERINAPHRVVTF